MTGETDLVDDKQQAFITRVGDLCVRVWTHAVFKYKNCDRTFFIIYVID